MKKASVLVIVACLMAFGCAKDQSQRIEGLEKENAALKEMIAPPPQSLAAYYPPNTGQPVYSMRMMGMAAPLMGMMVDMMENCIFR